MSNDVDEMCGCGQRLHYTDVRAEAYTRYQVKLLGPNVTVTTEEGSWRVPRHYIALHGLAAADLPQLAERYGWEKA